MGSKFYSFFGDISSKKIVCYLTNFYPVQADIIEKFYLRSNYVGLSFSTIAVFLLKTDLTKLRNTFIVFTLTAFAFPVVFYNLSKLKNFESFRNFLDVQGKESQQYNGGATGSSSSSSFTNGSSNGLKFSDKFINDIVKFIESSEKLLTETFNDLSEEKRDMANLYKIIEHKLPQDFQNSLLQSCKTHLSCQVLIGWSLIGDNKNILRIEIKQDPDNRNKNFDPNLHIQSSFMHEEINKRINNGTVSLNFNNTVSLEEKKNIGSFYTVSY